jgi:hypothetical protein
MSSSNGTSESSDDFQRVSEFFESNAGAIERWLKEKAPAEVINQINSIVSKHTACEKEHRSSVTSELYQQWLSSSSTPLKVRAGEQILINVKVENSLDNARSNQHENQIRFAPLLVL